MPKNRIVNTTPLWIPNIPIRRMELVEIPYPTCYFQGPELDGMRTKTPLFEWDVYEIPFAPSNGKLMCLREAEAKIDPFLEAAGRGHSLHTLTTIALGDALGTESFQHFLLRLDTNSAKEILQAVNNYGMAFMPIANSQKRYIDFRHHDQSSGYGILDYARIYRCDLFPDDARLRVPSGDAHETKLSKLLANAVWDIYSDEIRASMHNAGFRFQEMSFAACHRWGGYVAAAALSEYARKATLSENGAQPKGVVSLAEVALTFAMLQESINAVIDAEIADSRSDEEAWDTWLNRMETRRTTRPVPKEIARMYREQEMEPENKEQWAKVSTWANARDAMRFLSECAFSVTGATTYTASSEYLTAADEKERRLGSSPTFPLLEKYAEGTLAAFLVGDFYKTLESPDKWRTCKSCRFVFKHKQKLGAASSGRKPRNDSLYCCEACANSTPNGFTNAETSCLRAIRKNKRNMTQKDALKYMHQKMKEKGVLANRKKKDMDARWKPMIAEIFQERELNREAPSGKTRNT